MLLLVGVVLLLLLLLIGVMLLLLLAQRVRLRLLRLELASRIQTPIMLFLWLPLLPGAIHTCHGRVHQAARERVWLLASPDRSRLLLLLLDMRLRRILLIAEALGRVATSGHRRRRHLSHVLRTLAQVLHGHLLRLLAVLRVRRRLAHDRRLRGGGERRRIVARLLGGVYSVVGMAGLDRDLVLLMVVLVVVLVVVQVVGVLWLVLLLVVVAQLELLLAVLALELTILARLLARLVQVIWVLLLHQAAFGRHLLMMVAAHHLGGRQAETLVLLALLRRQAQVLAALLAGLRMPLLVQRQVVGAREGFIAIRVVALEGSLAGVLPFVARQLVGARETRLAVLDIAQVGLLAGVDPLVGLQVRALGVDLVAARILAVVDAALLQIWVVVPVALDLSGCGCDGGYGLVGRGQVLACYSLHADDMSSA